MKLTKPILGVWAVILACNLVFLIATAKGQTNGFFGNLGDELDQSGILKATNYAVEPYATFAPHAPRNNRWGGGLLAVYNVNNNVGLGLGIDYLGRFSLVSGNAELKLPIHPLSSYKSLPSVLQNLELTPFALAGVGRPMSGASSDLATITDAGAYIKFGHLWGGQFNFGGAYGRWDNAGAFSGPRYHVFAGWAWGF